MRKLLLLITVFFLSSTVAVFALQLRVGPQFTTSSYFFVQTTKNPETASTSHNAPFSAGAVVGFEYADFFLGYKQDVVKWLTTDSTQTHYVDLQLMLKYPIKINSTLYLIPTLGAEYAFAFLVKNNGVDMTTVQNSEGKNYSTLDFDTFAIKAGMGVPFEINDRVTFYPSALFVWNLDTPYKADQDKLLQYTNPRFSNTTVDFGFDISLVVSFNVYEFGPRRLF